MGGAASVNVDDVPEVMTESDCRELAGPHFDEGLFQSVSNNGTISKQRLAQIISVRTDCFLTHDWGKELGQDNHARVALVNAALQRRGLKTWFDAEQMQGNIKKQMVAGIDNTQCVVVFITKRYTEKVSGDNAEDNCQLEFNYAALRKTAARMVAVVMEERMRNTRAWMGEVAMVLGGRLYVDMCGDLNDESYLNAKVDELFGAITAVIGTPVKQFGLKLGVPSVQQRALPNVGVGESAQTVPSAASKISDSNRALTSLTVKEVSILMENLNLGQFKNKLAENSIDGECLAACDSSDDVKEMGVSMAVKAKLLFTKLCDYRDNGVPEQLIFNRQEEEEEEVSSDEVQQPDMCENDEEATEDVLSPELAEEQTLREAIQQPRCQMYHDMPYTLTSATNGHNWTCDFCAQSPLDRPGTLWALGRYYCHTCPRANNNMCTSCYDEAGVNNCPVDKKGHAMRFTLHRNGMTSDGYRTGWLCDVCRGGSERSVTGVNGRFCCLNCTSDFCYKHKEGHVINEISDSVACSVHQHMLSLAPGKDGSGWACDGRRLPGGCKGGCTDFYQTKGWNCWTCKPCDFDLCQWCVQAYAE